MTLPCNSIIKQQPIVLALYFEHVSSINLNMIILHCINVAASTSRYALLHGICISSSTYACQKASAISQIIWLHRDMSGHVMIQSMFRNATIHDRLILNFWLSQPLWKLQNFVSWDSHFNSQCESEKRLSIIFLNHPVQFTSTRMTRFPPTPDSAMCSTRSTGTERPDLARSTTGKPWGVCSSCSSKDPVLAT